MALSNVLSENGEAPHTGGTVASQYTSIRLSQPWKHVQPIVLRVDGRYAYRRLSQLPNASELMVVTPSGMFTPATPLLKKAHWSIIRSDVGRLS